MKAQATYTSTITPEMIGHYRQLLALRHDRTDRLFDHDGFGNRLVAYPDAYPFFIRFDQHPDPTASAAYLTAVDGHAEWRYAHRDPGYTRCPVERHPDAIRQLDEIFMLYYRKNCLPESLSEARHLSGRLSQIDDWFFSGEEEVDHSIVIEEEIIGELFCYDGPWLFLEYIRDALYLDAGLFKISWVKACKPRKRILALRFDRQVCFVDVGMAGNLYLHLLLTLNELFWPRHEIRRYRNGNTGHGGILCILSVREWDRLADIRGQAAVDARFERITQQTVIDYPTDTAGIHICTYQKEFRL